MPSVLVGQERGLGHVMVLLPEVSIGSVRDALVREIDLGHVVLPPTEVPIGYFELYLTVLLRFPWATTTPLKPLEILVSNQIKCIV